MDHIVVPPRDGAKRRGCEAMKRRFSPLCRVRECQRPTGLGAWATADMAGKRPLRALGPMMSALNFWSFSFKRKGRI